MRWHKAMKLAITPTMLALIAGVPAGCDQGPERSVTLNGDQSYGERGDLTGDQLVFGDGSGTRLVVDPERPEQVRAGEPFTYSITVRNEGEAAAHNVLLRRVDSDNVQPARDGGQEGAEKGVWRVGTLSPGESERVSIRLVPQNEGEMHACLAVEYDSAICAEIPVVSPELEIERIVPQQAFICDDLEIEYVVRNVGSGATRPVTIVEQLPEGLATADGGRSVRIDAGQIRAGGQISESVAIRPESGGEYQGRAMARTGQMSAESRPSTVRILDPELRVRIDGPQREYLDRPVTYSIAVTNTSDDPAPDTMVNVPLPGNVERPTYAGAQMSDEGEFELGDLAPGETRRFSVTFNGVEPGEISLAAKANAYCAEATSATITTQLEGIAALRVETVDLVDPVPIGEQTTYRVQLKNQGSAKGSNIRAVAELPEGLIFVEAEGDSPVRHNNGRIEFEPLGELAPGAVAEWLITCRAVAAGKVNFQLYVESDATSRRIIETEPTTLY